MNENTYKSKNQVMRELAIANDALKSRMGDIKQLYRENAHLSAELENSNKLAKQLSDSLLKANEQIEELQKQVVDHSGLFAPIGEVATPAPKKAKITGLGTGSAHKGGNPNAERT